MRLELGVESASFADVARFYRPLRSEHRGSLPVLEKLESFSGASVGLLMFLRDSNCEACNRVVREAVPVPSSVDHEVKIRRSSPMYGGDGPPLAHVVATVELRAGF